MNFSRYPLSFLKKYLARIFAATAASLALGLVSAALGVALGPTLQALFLGDMSQNDFNMQELFGFRMVYLLSFFVALPHTVNRDQLLSVLPVSLLIFGTIRALLGAWQFYAWEDLSERLARDLRNDLIKNYLNLRPESRYQPQVKEFEANISTIFSSDLRLVREFVVRVYGAVPREFFQIGFLLFALLMIEAKLVAMFLLIGLPFSFLLRRLGKSLRKRSRAVLEEQARISEWIQQRLLGFETIRHYKSESFEKVKMNHFFDVLQKRLLRALQIKSLSSPVMEAIAACALALILWLTLSNQMGDTLSGSMKFSFFSTLALLVQSADRLGRYLNANREGRVALDRLRTARSMCLEFASSSSMNLVPSNLRSEKSETSDVAIAFKKVSYTYPGSTNLAVSNLDLKFFRSKLNVIAGPSGSGKSTVLRLVLGLISEQSGSVDRNISVDRIGYLPQDLAPRAGSIASQLSYPLSVDPSSKPQVIGSLKAVGLDQIADEVDHHFELSIGEGKRDFSGGQMQKLQMARLRFHGYPLVVIDEGTSALDPHSEKDMIDLLKSWVKEQKATVIAVAHRPAMIAAADHLIEL